MLCIPCDVNKAVLLDLAVRIVPCKAEILHCKALVDRSDPADSGVVVIANVCIINHHVPASSFIGNICCDHQQLFNADTPTISSKSRRNGGELLRKCVDDLHAVHCTHWCRTCTTSLCSIKVCNMAPRLSNPEGTELLWTGFTGKGDSRRHGNRSGHRDIRLRHRGGHTGRGERECGWCSGRRRRWCVDVNNTAALGVMRVLWNE